MSAMTAKQCRQGQVACLKANSKANSMSEVARDAAMRQFSDFAAIFKLKR